MPRTGTGRIYQQAGSAVWWVDYSVRGKRYRESSGSTKKADATRLLKKRLGEQGAGTFVGPDAEKVTFEDLESMIATDYKVNARKSRPKLHHLKAFFGMSRALDITTDRVKLYIVSRQEAGAANATIQQELANLKRAFNLAVKAGRLPSRPYIPSVKVSNTREGFFEAAELERVIAKLPAYLQPVVRFAYLTGWRKSEVLTLQWSQVDFESGVVRLAPGSTKNDDGRELAFRALPVLAALLDAQRAHTREEEKRTEKVIPHVFHHHGGQPVRDMNGAWRKATEEAGLKGWLFHDLRRTAVRNLERAGVSRSIAMSVSGHRTESIYRRYAIVDRKAQEEGLAKLAALHAQPSEPAKVLPIAR